MKYSLNIDLHRPNTSLAPSPRQSLPDLPGVWWLGEFLLFFLVKCWIFSGGGWSTFLVFTCSFDKTQNTHKTSHKTLEFEVHVSKYSPQQKNSRHGTFHAASCGATGSTTQTTLGAVTCYRNAKVLEVKKKMAKKWRPFGRFSESNSETPRLFGCQMTWKLIPKKKWWDKETKIDPSFTKTLWEKNQSLPSSHPFLSGWFPTLRIQKNSLVVEHSYSAPFLNGRMARSHETLRKFGILSWGAVKKIQGCDPNHNQKKNPLLGGWTNPSEKYARQIGNLPQFYGWKLKKKRNH